MKIETLSKALLAILFCLSISLVGCGTKEQEQQQEEEILPDSVDMDGMVMQREIEACLAEGDQICEVGLPFAQIGFRFPDLDLSQWPDARVEDNIKTTEDYAWLERTIVLPEGSLVLDGEVFEAANHTDSLLYNSFIIRLRIETDLFHTAKDISVGSKVEELKALNDEYGFIVVPIPDFEAISIVSEKTRLAYLIRDAGNEMSQALSKPSIEDLAADAEIYAIVVM